jgi:hypothetical protein
MFLILKEQSFVFSSISVSEIANNANRFLDVIGVGYE